MHDRRPRPFDTRCLVRRDHGRVPHARCRTFCVERLVSSWRKPGLMPSDPSVTIAGTTERRIFAKCPTGVMGPGFPRTISVKQMLSLYRNDAAHRTAADAPSQESAACELVHLSAQPWFATVSAYYL